MHKCFTAALLALVALGALPHAAHAWVKEGVAAGVVITTGEDRVVVAVQEGGQITFEAASIKQGDQWVKDEHQLAFLKTLKQNDHVRIGWGTDHTGHYYIREIVKDAGDARPAGDAALVEQVRALRGEVASLRQEIAALREKLAKLLEK